MSNGVCHGGSLPRTRTLFPPGILFPMTILTLFNTLSRTQETFTAQEPPHVKMYCCGPTVYNFAHIGNLRTYVFEDILHRVLLFNGYTLTHVMNITDVGHMTTDADAGRRQDAWSRPPRGA